MDKFFEHFHKVMDEIVFSGFFDRRPNNSPRDEMLRNPEDDVEGELPTPEPWTPFPFYGDLCKPDMMDRDFFRESQRRRLSPVEPKKDIILDDVPSNQLLSPDRHTEVHKWSQTVRRKTIIGPDGQKIESETHVLREPDGTQVHTTIERSPERERRRIVHRKPSGEAEVEETDIPFQERSTVATNRPDDQDVPSGSWFGVFDRFRKWYTGKS